MIQFGKMVADGVFANSTAIYENNSIKITSPSNSEVINFYAPVDGNSNDSYFVNNSLVTLLNQVGETPDYGWKEGSPIYGVYDSNNNKLFIKTTKSKIKTNYSAILSENTWEQIAQACADRDPILDVWQVGDEKDEVINGETLTFVIVGKDHDDLADGSGKAPLTFGMKELMAKTHRMNPTNTNVGSFAGSEMCTYLNTDILNAMPDELKNNIKPVTKQNTAGGDSTAIVTESSKLWLFSITELGSTFSYAGVTGSKYDYYATNTSLVKKAANGTGWASYWWTRDPRTSNDTSFCAVSTSGSINSYPATSTCSVCFGFCI